MLFYFISFSDLLNRTEIHLRSLDHTYCHRATILKYTKWTQCKILKHTKKTKAIFSKQNKLYRAFDSVLAAGCQATEEKSTILQNHNFEIPDTDTVLW